MKNQIVELVKLVSENGLEVSQLAAVLNILFVGKLGELIFHKILLLTSKFSFNYIYIYIF